MKHALPALLALVAALAPPAAALAPAAYAYAAAGAPALAAYPAQPGYTAYAAYAYPSYAVALYRPPVRYAIYASSTRFRQIDYEQRTYLAAYPLPAPRYARATALLYYYPYSRVRRPVRVCAYACAPWLYGYR